MRSDPATLPVFAFTFNVLFEHQYAANGSSEYIESELYRRVVSLLKQKLDNKARRLMLLIEVYQEEEKYLGVLRRKGRNPVCFDVNEFVAGLGDRCYEIAYYQYLSGGELKVFSQAAIDYSQLHLITDLSRLSEKLVAKNSAIPANMYVLQAGRVGMSDMQNLEKLIQASKGPCAEIFLDVDGTLVHGSEPTSFMAEQLDRIHRACLARFPALRYFIVTARFNDTEGSSTSHFTTVRDVCTKLFQLTGVGIQAEDIIFTSGRFNKADFIGKSGNFRLFFDDQAPCLRSMASKVSHVVLVRSFEFTEEAWDRLARNLALMSVDLEGSMHSLFGGKKPGVAEGLGDDILRIRDQSLVTFSPGSAS